MKKSAKIIIAAAAPAAALFLLIFRGLILKISYYSPKCWIYLLTGYYCPGCGNTRSVRALLRGDILTALHNNITIPLLAVLLLLLYIELIFSIFDKKIMLLPRNLPFWLVVIGLMVAYFILRNFIGCMAPIMS